MIWNPFVKNIKKNGIIDFVYNPTINSSVNISKLLTEQFKGEIEKKDVKFPKELGEEHSFDFKQLEELYKNFGFFTAVVDKYIDFVVGPGFFIECEDERAKKIIDDFIRDVNLDTVLRAWIKEALVKGNGFLEIGGNKKDGVDGLKVLNANQMYVMRDNYGKIIGYNQYVGGFKDFNYNSSIKRKQLITFAPEQIAHFLFNVIGDSGYGLGIGYPAFRDINNFLQNDKDSHFIMSRKANSPLHAQLGKVEGDIKIIPKAEDVTAFGAKMETMSNKTEWATDPLVNFKVIDFGNIGDKFAGLLEHDKEMLFYIFQIPAVLMGMSNVPEGLAQVQMDAFERRIQSIQSEVEKIIEQQIFKRVLNANGFDVYVEFQWGRPSNQEKHDRLLRLTELMRIPVISGSLSNLIEKDIVKILDYNQKEYESMTAEEERKREEERPQPLVPGQNENKPQKPEPKEEQPKQPKPEENYSIQLEIIKVLQGMQEEQKRNKEQSELKSTEEKEKIMSIVDFIKQETERVKKENEEKIAKLEEGKQKEVEIKQELIRNKEEIPSIKNKLLRLKRRESIIPITKEFIEQNTHEYKIDIEDTTRNSSEKFIIQNSNKKENEKDLKEDFESINDIEEWLGFSYKKYLQQIHNALENYDFNQIRALTEAEHLAGYLSDSQVEEVRKILDNGFKKGLGIKEMSKQVDKIGLKDLYRMTEDGQVKIGASGLPILAKSAEKRSIGIVRSEVTRLANMGAVGYYKENGVDKVKWIASFGDRTCPECESLNGQIFDIGNEPEMPLHSMCRCCYGPVVELK